MGVPAPDDAALTKLLDEYAPFRPSLLCPEISVFQGLSLVDVWEAAERLAGEAVPSPFWAYAWPAGSALARVIIDYPDHVRDQRVLDVGAGGGIVSLAAAHAGARQVVANDVDPWALATVAIAAKRQRLEVECLLEDLTEQVNVVAAYDVIVCSDMAYERRMAPRYTRLLKHARNLGKRVLVADAGRTYFVADGLKLLAEYDIEVPKDLEGVAMRHARVFEMQLSAS